MTDRELAEIAQDYLAEITRLRAENARLRVALELIVRMYPEGDLDGADAVAVARRALR